MTELATRDNYQPASVQPQMPVSAGSSSLEVWAHELQQAATIADQLCRTSFVPAAMRGKPAETAAAILAGQELGLPPMSALRSMDIIQGTPALKAHAMRGLVQSHGHSVQVVQSTDVLCVMRGRRSGEQEWQTSEWPIARAELLGLTSKSQWKLQPKTMLVARATGEICRLIASDVLFAMPYTSEELETSDEFEAIASAPRVTATEILRPAPAPAAVAPAVAAAPAPPAAAKPGKVTADEIVAQVTNPQGFAPAAPPAAQNADPAPARSAAPAGDPSRASTWIAAAQGCQTNDADLTELLDQAQEAGFAPDLADQSDSVARAFTAAKNRLADSTQAVPAAELAAAPNPPVAAAPAASGTESEVPF